MKFDYKGAIWQKKGRWYWTTKLPGEINRRTITLARPGEAATTSEKNAQAIAQKMWDEALARNEGNGWTASMTIAELKKHFKAWAKDYFKPGSMMIYEVDSALALLDCDNTPAADFGPRMLDKAKSKLVGQDPPLSQRTVNGRLAYIRRMFQFAVAKEWVGPEVAFALKCIPNVTGKTKGVKASESRTAVPVEHVRATLPYLSTVLQAVVKIQLLTGMRPSELLVMKPIDIDSSKDVWIYSPEWHKNQWRGEKYKRRVALPKDAQNILILFMANTKQDQYIFRPEDAVGEHNRKRAENRETPLNCGNRPGTKCKGTLKLGDRYNESAYRVAVKRAIDRLNDDRREQKLEIIPVWTPYQLRHTAATVLRAAAGDKGLTMVQACLGQKTFAAAERYAELEKALACESAKIVQEQIRI